MTRQPMVHKVDGDEDPRLAPTFAEQFAPEGDEPKTTDGGWLDDMAAEYDQMVAEIVELRIAWPFWKGKLVATFGLLDDGQSKRLREVVKNGSGSKTDRGRQMICNFLAESCTSLEWKGRRLDEGKGFGPNAARALKAPAGASQGDLAWLATKQDSEVLGKFGMKVLKWSEDPVTEDRTEDVDGPFDSE